MAKLEPEQEQLLVTIVELVRSVPRDQRHSFILSEMQQADALIMPGSSNSPQVLASDVRALEHEGLLRRAPGGDRYDTPYDVTPAGFAYYVDMSQRTGEPSEAIENTVMSYLEASDFRRRHPGAYEKWRQATDELWGTDTERELTSVGHHAREAMQLFASEAVDRYDVASAPPEIEKTINRVRAIVDLAKAKPGIGEAEGKFLDALVTFWRASNGLAQRQEHGNTKGASLAWEDARRLVFATAQVMFELDRALVRAIGK